MTDIEEVYQEIDTLTEDEGYAVGNLDLILDLLDYKLKEQKSVILQELDKELDEGNSRSIFINKDGLFYVFMKNPMEDHKTLWSLITKNSNTMAHILTDLFPVLTHDQYLERIINQTRHE